MKCKQNKRGTIQRGRALRRATKKAKPKTLFAKIAQVYPGVKQDETGFTYRIGLTASGEQVQLPVTLPGRSGKEMWAKS